MNTGLLHRHQAMLVQALGPIIQTALATPGTVEVLVNADGRIWHEVHGQAMVCIGEQATGSREAVIRLAATLNQRTVHAGRPSLDAVLPGGQRFKGFLPPRTTAPAYCIRCHQAQVLTRNDYVPDACPAEVWDVLAQAVAARDNVLLVGGMGSGKTTLLNALSRLIPDDVRLVSMEDTAEASLSVPNYLQLYTSDGAGLQEVVKEGFRTAAGRVLVGEIRDGETAVNTLKLWLGVGGGLATTHGESARDGLTRLAYLCAEVGGGDYGALIGDVIDVVGYMAHVAGQRRLEEVTRVNGWREQRYDLETVWRRGSSEPAAPRGSERG